jgi:hypothetical protein
MRLSEWSEWEHKHRSAWQRGELLWACVEAVRQRRRANPDLSLEEVADQLEVEAREQIGEAERIATEVLGPAAAERVRWTAEELGALQFTREQAMSWRDDASDVYAWLEGEPGEATIAVIFKHRDYPGCMFGSRGWAVAEMVEYVDPHPSLTVMWANIEEEMDASDLGLPSNPTPGEVTWI